MVRPVRWAYANDGPTSSNGPLHSQRFGRCSTPVIPAANSATLLSSGTSSVSSEHAGKRCNDARRTRAICRKRAPRRRRLLNGDVELFDVVVVVAFRDRVGGIDGGEQYADAGALAAALDDDRCRFACRQLAAGARQSGVDPGIMTDRASEAGSRNDLTGLVQRLGKDDVQFD